MLQTTQDISFTLFNAIEMDWKWLSSAVDYVNHLLTSPKKAVHFYTKEEHSTFPGWKLLRCLPTILQYQETLEEYFWEQIETHLDRRRPVIVATDDYVVKRYGRRAYGTGYFYSNAHGGITWGNQLVDTVLTHGNLTLPVKHEIHLKEAPLKVWEQGVQQLNAVVSTLQTYKVPKKKIWLTGDCKYTTNASITALREMGVFYLLGVPKTRIVELFGEEKSLAQFFVSQPERTLTVGSRTYTYKCSTANVRNCGRHRLLAVYEAGKGWK